MALDQNRYERGSHWFLERRQERKLIFDILCPNCGAKDTWFPKDDYPPAKCYSCGYPESADISKREVRAKEPLPELTTLRAYLRRHRPTQLNVWGDAAFRIAFPRFAPPNWTEEEKAKARASADPRLIHLAFQPSQLRRYGGYDLGRGAYSSLAIDKNGFDCGTLCSELNAYRESAEKDLLVDAIDGFRIKPEYFGPSLPESIANIIQTCFVVRIFPASRLRPLVEARSFEMSNPESIHHLQDDAVAEIILKPEVTQVEIERVVDLRFPATRESFFRIFQTGISISDVPAVLDQPLYSRLLGENITSFYQMLPELLDLEIGGGGSGAGGLTQAIGDYLRARNVSGLVFPSARADWFAEFRDGHLEQFGGWNFVDFRNSPPPRSQHFVIGGPWNLRVPEGISINGPKSGTYAGSLQIKGLAEVNMKRYENSRPEGLRAREIQSPRRLTIWGSTTLDELASATLAPKRYKTFDDFLNALQQAVVTSGEDEAVVRRGLDWLLDRGNFGEYGIKAQSADGATDTDVMEASKILKKFINTGTM